MVRRLPSLNGLRAFEAAARHESFTKAADELFVTQGAVSHQVKALEAELGVKFFNREPKRLVITEAGRGYLDVVRDALGRIAAGTDQLLQRQNAGVLTVSTSPNFATKWLVHRLGRFAVAHPEIDLRVSANLQHVDFAREDIDIAVRHGDGTDLGLHITQLYTEELLPVCSPALLEGPHPLRVPGDLAHHTLLHMDHRQDWSKWLVAAGVEREVAEAVLSHGPVFDQASMGIDAAVNGQGVALARTGLAAHDLIAGRLIRPFDLALAVPYAYWIVCPKATADLPKIVTFRNWLLAEAAEDLRQLAELAP
jgi:LysR family glycine cleavage system transcriptional activator